MMSCNKMFTFLTVLIIIICTNSIEAGRNASSSTSTPISYIELSVEYRLTKPQASSHFLCLPRLKKENCLAQSNPVVVTFEKEVGQTEWKEIHRTEAIKNNHKAEFVTKFVTHCRIEEKYSLRFEVYDLIDSNCSESNEQNFIGMTDAITLGTLVDHGRIESNLKCRQSDEVMGVAIIVASLLGGDTSKVTFKMSGHNLDKNIKFLRNTTPNPFLQIYKEIYDKNYVLVWHNDPQMGTTEPEWEQFEIPVWLLCNGDRERDLKFVCSHFSSTGVHKVIGEFHTNLWYLSKMYYETTQNDQSVSLTIFNHEKDTRINYYANSGEIRLNYFKSEPHVTFEDYIKDGIEISCAVAIDFTGDIIPNDTNYVDGYELAIQGVVSTLENYCTDKNIPLFGFGNRAVSDVEILDPLCRGAQDVLKIYRDYLKKTNLDRLTNFAPIINHMVEIVKHEEQPKNYHILLILTNGRIDDKSDTVKAIVRASYLPISIIIVGIGEADFTAMKELAKPLSNDRGERIRDVVQFVEIQKEIENADSVTCNKKPAGKELAVVSKQLVSYMLSKNIFPSNKNIPDYYHKRSKNNNRHLN